MPQKHPMIRRSAATLFALSLAACGGGDDEAEQAAASAAADVDRIECAVGGAEQFEPVCSIERIAGPEGLTLTVRNPDGGFRRLLVTRDGRGVAAADGAEQAVVSAISGNRIEVSLAGDRYRIPATVKR
jgi:hypothetical protein